MAFDRNVKAVDVEHTVKSELQTLNTQQIQKKN